MKKKDTNPWMGGDDDKVFDVKEGDLILIEDGVFHRVHNTGTVDLYMVCVFDGGRNH